MSLPSEREIHLVGDIVEEAGRICEFVSDMTEDAFSKDLKCVYAVEKALQNITEACIQLEGKQCTGRFNALFPNQSYATIRKLGNKLRHDYGGLDTSEIWNQIQFELPSLREEAEALLKTQRRAFGGNGEKNHEGDE